MPWKRRALSSRRFVVTPLRLRFKRLGSLGFALNIRPLRVPAAFAFALLLPLYIGYNEALFGRLYAQRTSRMTYYNATKKGALACLAASAFVLAGCAGMNGSSSPTTTGGTSSPGGGFTNASTPNAPTDLSGVKTWSIETAKYLGKTPDVVTLAANTSDLMIVDPEDLESKDHPLDKQLAAVRGKSPKRIILATIDCGSIATSSPLWNPSWVDSSGKLSVTAPEWLVAPLPKTSTSDGSAQTASTTDQKSPPAQYRVHYWNRAWRTLLSGRIDALRKAGFDGICVEGLGAYTAFTAEHPTAAADMAQLVENLAQDARAHASNFYVVPVDNDALADKLDQKPQVTYLKAVDGVVAENVFYHGDKSSDNDLNPQPDMITALDKYEYDHRPVFVIDSVTSSDKVADFEERAKARGYLPTAAPALTAAAPAAQTRPATDTSTPAPSTSAPASAAPATQQSS